MRSVRSLLTILLWIPLLILGSSAAALAQGNCEVAVVFSPGVGAYVNDDNSFFLSADDSLLELGWLYDEVKIYLTQRGMSIHRDCFMLPPITPHVC